MSLINTLENCYTKDLLRVINSDKAYLFFDISVFNAGVSINIKCTDTFKQINENTWNGYDFIIENDRTTKSYITNILKERVNNPLEDDLTPIQIKRITKLSIN